MPCADLEPEVARELKRRRVATATDLAGTPLPREVQLKAKGVTKPTLTKYLQAIQYFEEWCQRQSHRFRTPAQVDRAMTLYLTDEYELGEKSWNGSHLVFGHQLLRNKGPDKDYLPEAKKALKAWKKRTLHQMRTPVPEEIVLSMGDALLDDEEIDVAVALSLQLDGYFRPSEIAELKTRQVMPPAMGAGPAYAKWGIVLAPQALGATTKTGQTDDSVLVGDVAHEWLHDVLQLQVRGKTKNQKLFPNLNLRSYEGHLARVSKTMQLPVYVSPHVVRHSGASNDRFHKRRSLLQIQKRGRWASTKSMLRYEKEALLLAAWDHFELNRQKQLVAKARAFPQRLLKMMRSSTRKP
jgi:hypothetical protein